MSCAAQRVQDLPAHVSVHRMRALPGRIPSSPDSWHHTPVLLLLAAGPEPDHQELLQHDGSRAARASAVPGALALPAGQQMFVPSPPPTPFRIGDFVNSAAIDLLRVSLRAACSGPKTATIVLSVVCAILAIGGAFGLTHCSFARCPFIGASVRSPVACHATARPAVHRHQHQLCADGPVICARLSIVFHREVALPQLCRLCSLLVRC